MAALFSFNFNLLFSSASSLSRPPPPSPPKKNKQTAGHLARDPGPVGIAGDDLSATPAAAAGEAAAAAASEASSKLLRGPAEGPAAAIRRSPALHSLLLLPACFLRRSGRGRCRGRGRREAATEGRRQQQSFRNTVRGRRPRPLSWLRDLVRSRLRCLRRLRPPVPAPSPSSRPSLRRPARHRPSLALRRLPRQENPRPRPRRDACPLLVPPSTQRRFRHPGRDRRALCGCVRAQEAARR